MIPNTGIIELKQVPCPLMLNQWLPNCGLKKNSRDSPEDMHNGEFPCVPILLLGKIH
jgi:hypothetical protein